MKARLKETGKWITVDTCAEGFYEVETHDIYYPDELDFAPAFDWDVYRREAAKDILCAMLAGDQIGDGKYYHTFKQIAQGAVVCADELIEKLKEK